MATNLQTRPEPSVPTLVSGIVQDAQELLKQQADLFKHEVSTAVNKAREASVSLGLGACLLVLSGILLCLAVVYLLHETLSLPLWACYLIVGALVGLPGGIMAWRGYKQFQSFSPLPEQSAEAMKENLEWTTKPR